MSKIIEFNKSSNVNKFNIRFVTRASSIDISNPNARKPVMKKHAVICLRNDSLDREAVHPITDFIFTHWKHAEYNSMAMACNKIVPFLNWVYFESKYKISDLSEITINMFIEFLELQIYKGSQKATVHKYANVIHKFYIYLYNNEILTTINPSKIERMSDDVLPGLVHNKKESSKKIHEFKPELIIPFIETAYEVSNCIALGVYYQIFGGLRYGEVVNITKSSIKHIGSNGEFGQVLKIKKRELRKDLSSTSGKGEVKRDRDQVIFPYKGLLKKMYESHIKVYQCLENKDALFIDSNGNPMTADTYRYHFEKVKKAFIEKLKNSDDIRIVTYAKYLDDMDWSTHIGRGLFSNLMAEYTDNILEITIARGDRNVNSSLVYQADTRRILNKIERELDLMYEGDFLSR